MDFLHSQRIVHGDLKPVKFSPLLERGYRLTVSMVQANVLIDAAHCARITDFGLSKVKLSMSTQTVADAWEKGQAKTPGTRVFMALEVAARHNELCDRCLRICNVGLSGSITPLGFNWLLT